jgi:hypothetical protein
MHCQSLLHFFPPLTHTHTLPFNCQLLDYQIVAQLEGLDILVICAYDIGVLFVLDALKVSNLCRDIRTRTYIRHGLFYLSNKKCEVK